METAATLLAQTFTIKRKRLGPDDREIKLTEHGALNKADGIAAQILGRSIRM